MSTAAATRFAEEAVAEECARKQLAKHGYSELKQKLRARAPLVRCPQWRPPSGSLLRARRRRRLRQARWTTHRLRLRWMLTKA